MPACVILSLPTCNCSDYDVLWLQSPGSTPGLLLKSEINIVSLESLKNNMKGSEAGVVRHKLIVSNFIL